MNLELDSHELKQRETQYTEILKHTISKLSPAYSKERAAVHKVF